jgi:hypothetical protein
LKIFKQGQKFTQQVSVETDTILEISWSREFQKGYSRFRPKKKPGPQRFVICSREVP